MTLYIVATPIGNLEDISLRALKVLRAVDEIYCEDTRRTKILLTHFSIHKRVVTLHHHSPDAILEAMIRALQEGKDIAYLSDAGTPGISDPGGKLVERAHLSGVTVSPLPGPSSVSTLISVAGFPSDRFVFAGFVPTKKHRRRFIQELMVYDETVVFFETAPRLIKLLEYMIELNYAKREMVIGRELTKQFEEIRRDTIQGQRDYYINHLLKGELVIALSSK